MTLCAVRAATVLSRNCCAEFGRPLTKKVISHSRDGPGVTAPLRTNIVLLTGVWNPPPSVTPLKKSPKEGPEAALTQHNQESHLFSQGKTPEFIKKNEIHELFLRSRPFRPFFWFGLPGASPDIHSGANFGVRSFFSHFTPDIRNRRSAKGWCNSLSDSLRRSFRI